MTKTKTNPEHDAFVARAAELREEVKAERAENAHRIDVERDSAYRTKLRLKLRRAAETGHGFPLAPTDGLVLAYDDEGIRELLALKDEAQARNAQVAERRAEQKDVAATARAIAREREAEEQAELEAEARERLGAS